MPNLTPERVVPNGPGTATNGDEGTPGGTIGRSANRRTGARTLSEDILPGRPTGDGEQTNREAATHSKAGRQTLTAAQQAAQHQTQTELLPTVE
jgi:hypothetical protein